MARSFRKPLALLLGALCVSGGVAAAAAPTGPAAAAAPAAPLPSSQLPITVDAASSQVDYKTNTVEFKQVVISQGATRVQADHAHATGLNFANSRWTFDGNVKIDAEPRGSLRSDQAVVEFKDNRILRATITGKPAEFEQQRSDSGQLARGHANQIVYDVNEGTVRLTEDAWLTDGQNQISGPLLVYDVRAQRVQAQGGTHITIVPGALQNPGKGEAPKTPPEGGRPKPQPEAPQ
jgi:lipopolysaccharide transport protein LptA